ncbi:MAG: ParB/RepB/Spo0J family partition protein [Solirubrobacteraceae bacterium]
MRDPAGRTNARRRHGSTLRAPGLLNRPAPPLPVRPEASQELPPQHPNDRWRLGRSRSDLVHTVRLLDLPDEAIELIDTGALSKGHGKALLTEPDHHRRRELAKLVAERGWSVRALEAEIARALQGRARPAGPHPDQVAAAARLRDLLASATGCELEARPHRLGYQVVLDQSAVDKLTKLLQPLTK